MVPQGRRLQPARFLVAAFAIGVALHPAGSRANGIVGEHMMVNTIVIDDPFPDDEATLPTFSWLSQPAGGGRTEDRSASGFEWDKRITDNFGFGISDGYQWLRQPGMKTANGWDNPALTLKYTPYVNAEHEFLVSLGVIRTFARAGANGSNGAALGNDDSDTTTPTLYWGKGLGDLPVPWLRPIAITGTIGYQVADRSLKATRATDPSDGVSTTLFNNGVANQWSGGVSIQYSMLYLKSQVQDLGLPEFVNRLTPVVEIGWSSPATKPNQIGTQFVTGLGIAYTEEQYAVGAEVLFPGNSQTGSHAGFVVQVHLYLDDLFPATLGKPILDW
jgi:hypothetical protein